MTRELFEKSRSEESVLIFGNPAIDCGVYHSLRENKTNVSDSRRTLKGIRIRPYVEEEVNCFVTTYDSKYCYIGGLSYLWY